MRSISSGIRKQTQSLLKHNRLSNTIVRLPRKIRLRDGKRLLLRELRPTDRNLLKTFFEHCSPESIHRRFLSSIRHFSEGLLDYLVNGDGHRHVALIVTQREGDEEKIVAEGRYAIPNDRPDSADVAFLVSDEMRRRGIATLLIQELIAIGGQFGLMSVTGDVLYENWEMVSLIRKLFRYKSSRISNGVIHFEIPIVEPLIT